MYRNKLLLLILLLMFPFSSGCSNQNSEAYPNATNGHRDSSQFNLSITRLPITAAGMVETTIATTIPPYNSEVSFFEAPQAKNAIIIQTSNIHLTSSEMLNNIKLGRSDQIQRLCYNGIAYELFIFSALITMGIYHLSLFFFRKQDHSPLYLGLFCILVAIQTLFIGEAFGYYLFPDLGFESAHKLQTLMNYLGVPLSIMFFKSVLPDYLNPLIVKSALIIGIGCSVIVLFMPIWIVATINLLYQSWSLFLIIYLFAVLVKASINKEKNSWLILFGGAFLLVTNIIDIALSSHWLNFSWFPLIGVFFQSDCNSSTEQFIFALYNSLLLAKHLSESIESKTIMSEKLIEMNTNLDEMVLQRTKALTASHKKIEQQNIELEQINQTLQQLSFKDPLTNLWNRRKYDETISFEWFRCLKHQQCISLLFIDVDFFKNFNDTYGHSAGDMCLIAIGAILRKNCSTDMVARYGGEEFIVLLPETGPDKGIEIASELLNKIEDLAIPNVGSFVSDYVTISIGVSSMIPDKRSSYENLVRTADKALYHAKSNGRNQVIYLAGPTLEGPD